MDNLQNFHFLYPLWLFALFPMAGLLWLIFNHKVADHAWSKIIDANLLPLLLNQGSTSQHGKLALWLLASAWFIGTLALANPVWEKKPRPVFQTNAARVIVFDLSRSMEIADLAPSRLARARFKIEDILRKKEEGQIGLVVFAGDAFTVVPLTRDADTIRSLLPSLMPKIMPIQGSRADLGLLKAAELLQQTGISHGEILLISDGVEGGLAQYAAQQIAAQGHTISVMAVGTEKGGAIPKVTDRQRNKIIVKLKPKTLQAVAEQGEGAYSLIQDNDDDLAILLTSAHKEGQDKANTPNNINSHDWKEQGPLLVLLLLPFAALAFRRGWLVSVTLVFFLSTQARPVQAFAWDDLWLRADQQADQAFQAGEFATASETAQDPMLRGNANYSQGNYEQAIESFSTVTGKNTVDALYNKANSLAKLGRYDEAIAAYNDVLKQQSNFSDATTNKKHIEILLKKQKEQQKQQQNKQDQQKSAEKGDKQTDKESKKQQEEEGEQQKNTSNKQQDAKESDSSDEEKKSTEQQNKAQDKAGKKDNAFDQASQDQEEKKDQQQEALEKEQAQQQTKQNPASASEQQDDNNKPSTSAEAIEKQAAKQLNREEKIAADQWLRRIPDNPGNLLQRKFKYQYQQRRAPEGTSGSNPW